MEVVVATNSKPCLIVYFYKVLRKRKGNLYDDAGVVIPSEVISFSDKHYIKFRDGFELIVQEDYFEIIYPGTSLVFSEGRVQNILVNYPNRK